MERMTSSMAAYCDRRSVNGHVHGFLDELLKPMGQGGNEREVEVAERCLEIQEIEVRKKLHEARVSVTPATVTMSNAFPCIPFMSNRRILFYR